MNYEEIARWYDAASDRIAGLFHRHSEVMHRPVYTAKQKYNDKRAMRYPEEFALKLISDHGLNRIVELGSGFASSLIYMSNIEPEKNFTGICASDREIAVSRDRIRDAGKIQSISVFKGDFEDPKNFRVFRKQDLVIAVESFGDVRDVKVLCGNIAGAISDTGRILVIDFFGETDDPRLRVLNTKQFTVAALEHGLEIVTDIDLSERIKDPVLQRMGKGLVRIVSAIIGKGRITGTLALLELRRQWAVSKKSIRYGLMELRKKSGPS